MNHSSQCICFKVRIATRKKKYETALGGFIPAGSLKPHFTASQFVQECAPLESNIKKGLALLPIMKLSRGGVSLLQHLVLRTFMLCSCDACTLINNLFKLIHNGKPKAEQYWSSIGLVLFCLFVCSLVNESLVTGYTKHRVGQQQRCGLDSSL